MITKFQIEINDMIDLGAEKAKKIIKIGERTPVSIIAKEDEMFGRLAVFYMDSATDANALGGIEEELKDISTEEILNATKKGGKFYLVGFDDSHFFLEYECLEEKGKPESKGLEEIKKEIVKKGLVTKERLDEILKVMKSNRIPEYLQRLIFQTYRKYNRPAHRPKTFYVDADPDRETSIMYDACVNILVGNSLVFDGDKSVGKNVCIETLAFIFNKPYYLVGFNFQMSPDDIYGGKKTDNSASSKLNLELAKSYNEYIARKGEVDADTKSKAGEFALYKAQSSSVHIVQEESEFVSWLEDGGMMCFNEFNMADVNFLQSVCNPLADGTQDFYVAGHGLIPINKDCTLICTENRGFFGSARGENSATLSRFGRISFPTAKKIKAQLKAECGYILPEDYYSQCENLYMDLYKCVTSQRNAQISNKCLSIRGICSALKAVALCPEAITLKSQLLINAFTACDADEMAFIENKVDDYISI